MEFDICALFENLSAKFKFRLHPTRTTNTLHEDLGTFMRVSVRILVIRKASVESGRENQNTHFVFNIFLFPGIVLFMR